MQDGKKWRDEMRIKKNGEMRRETKNKWGDRTQD